MGAGDFVCLQPSDIHNLHAVDARGFELINLAFSQEMMHSVLAFLEVDKETFFEEQITGHLSYENLLLLSETAKKLSGLPDRMREERLIVKEWIVVCLFCYQVSRKEESDMCPLWMKQLLRLLKTPEGFIGGVEFLKAHTEVSYPHVCRCFRKYLHKTPVEWINEQRILYSSYLLLDSRRASVTYTPDSNWINSGERVYPITIDPSVQAVSSLNRSSISDTYVHEGNGSCCSGINPSTHDRLYIGRKGNRIHRAYFKINTLPTIVSGSYINQAEVYAQCYNGTTTSKPFSINKVTSSWNDSTLGWSPQPASTDIQGGVERNTNYNVIQFNNCRAAIASLYNGNMANNGFMIHYTSETDNDYNSIYSYENANTSGCPDYRATGIILIIIVYVMMFVAHRLGKI